MALIAVAEALAPTDPDHVIRLLTDAERAARSITDEELRAWALTAVAKAVVQFL
jgi:hypothetical protein